MYARFDPGNFLDRAALLREVQHGRPGDEATGAPLAQWDTRNLDDEPLSEAELTVIVPALASASPAELERLSARIDTAIAAVRAAAPPPAEDVHSQARVWLHDARLGQLRALAERVEQEHAVQTRLLVDEPPPMQETSSTLAFRTAQIAVARAYVDYLDLQATHTVPLDAQRAAAETRLERLVLGMERQALVRALDYAADDLIATWDRYTGHHTPKVASQTLSDAERLLSTLILAASLLRAYPPDVDEAELQAWPQFDVDLRDAQLRSDVRQAYYLAQCTMLELISAVNTAGVVLMQGQTLEGCTDEAEVRRALLHIDSFILPTMKSAGLVHKYYLDIQSDVAGALRTDRADRVTRAEQHGVMAEMDAGLQAGLLDIAQDLSKADATLPITGEFLFGFFVAVEHCEATGGPFRTWTEWARKSIPYLHFDLDEQRPEMPSSPLDALIGNVRSYSAYGEGDRAHRRQRAVENVLGAGAAERLLFLKSG